MHGYKAREFYRNIDCAELAEIRQKPKGYCLLVIHMAKDYFEFLSLYNSRRNKDWQGYQVKCFEIFDSKQDCLEYLLNCGTWQKVKPLLELLEAEEGSDDNGGTINDR